MKCNPERRFVGHYRPLRARMRSRKRGMTVSALTGPTPEIPIASFTVCGRCSASSASVALESTANAGTPRSSAIVFRSFRSASKREPSPSSSRFSGAAGRRSARGVRSRRGCGRSTFALACSFNTSRPRGVSSMQGKSPRSTRPRYPPRSSALR